MAAMLQFGGRSAMPNSPAQSRRSREKVRLLRLLQLFEEAPVW
jgi:hypothetical protein